MDQNDIELTRRKILGSVGVVGLAGAGAGVGTTALFSDEESFDGNSVTAGTLDMSVDAKIPDGGINDEWAGAVGFDEYDPATADGEPGVGVTLEDMKPGDWVLLCYDITVESNPACIGLMTDKTANDENSVNEPEAGREDDISGSLDDPNTSVTDSISDPDGEGELAQNLEVTVYDDFDDSATLDGTIGSAESALSNELLGGVTLQDVWSTFDGGDAIASGTQSFDFCMLLELPTATGNEVQSDSVEWDFAFDAVQSRNNGDDPYGNACEPVWDDGGGPACECPDTPIDTTASQSPEVTVQSTDASGFPEVTTFLDIDTDAGTNGNLTAGDFALAENGCGQDISVAFTSEDKPIDMVFLLDVTGSMGGELDTMKTNIQDFIDSVEGEGVDARYALYLYGDEEQTGEPSVYLKQDFTSISTAFKTAVQNTTLEEQVGYGGDGPEDNYEAILTADNELSYRSDAQRVMIDITDAPGEEDMGEFIGGLEQTRANAVSVINGNDYTYIAVSPDDDGEHQKKPLAQDEADDGLWIKLLEDLDPILEELATEVTTSWRVRYTTACPVEDGSTRDVVIAIEDPVAGTLYATTSYTAP
ncbi:vWA domain-containing protein [Halobaculum gomorrense]|uniref:SipW-cognate class signal peptide n=1 Tax=Halobaculum gomorrense TaxID=43928 RepID=A0A1M5UG30_9EURY|nr:vWA domain-containing protein [Halobaculum gomorrense]SHH61593.1 SipW-cognate class signal peptide [Halobaculum gomorrense]